VRKRACRDSENRESWGRSHFDIGKSEPRWKEEILSEDLRVCHDR
jgi:hypothetical protein